MARKHTNKKRKHRKSTNYKPTIRKIDGNLWAKLKVQLPREKPRGTRGRPVVPYRIVINGILYRLRTGCQWKLIPAEYGSGSTCHRRFQEWVTAGIFEQMWRVLLRSYDHQRGIGWDWQVLDSVIVPAPLGGDKTGKNPTDRGKSGTKRHLLTDRRGVPLAVVLSGANEHDKHYAEQAVRATTVRRSRRNHQGHVIVRHCCADKGYDFEDVRLALQQLGYQVHIAHRRQRGEAEPPMPKGRRHPARRWVVERTNSWHNRFRALKIRWEKKPENYLALVHFACALIVFRFLG
jgi:putative transposase